MTVKYASLALHQIDEIWAYTADYWSDEQADLYVSGLFDFMENLETRKHVWRAVPYAALNGAFYAAYREHFVFFRHLPSSALGVIAILHQRQDIPSQLKDLS